jgi:plasmid maintenance system antidote protein VapI
MPYRLSKAFGGTSEMWLTMQLAYNVTKMLRDASQIVERSDRETTADPPRLQTKQYNLRTKSAHIGLASLTGGTVETSL